MPQVVGITRILKGDESPDKIPAHYGMKRLIRLRTQETSKVES